ncbi:MAG: LamG domain-containing protein [Candidatus Dojkabacteria bacterium]
MKKKKFKKVLICSGYLFLGIFFFVLIFILINKTLRKENEDIIGVADSNTYFRNINPKFSIDFVDGEYIRFESVGSYKNPFEEKKISLFQKIKQYLQFKNKREGIEIKLESISYDKEIEDITGKEFLESELNRSIELIDGKKIISKNIYRGIDIEYEVVKGKGLKEEIVLRDIPEYKTVCEKKECILPANRYIFKITLDEGLQLKRSITNLKEYPAGTYYVVDKKGNYFVHLLPEFAVDALGNKTSNLDIVIEPLEKNNEYLYKLTLDAQWLLSNERAFPVRIDPSIVHDSLLALDLGTYDRVASDQTSTVRLDSALSGEYTSSILDLGSNASLDDIRWSTFAQATGDRYIPFSQLRIILEENLSNMVVGKDKQTKTFNIPLEQSSFFTIESWIYQRYVGEYNLENIFRSSLGNIVVSDGVYGFQNTNGNIFKFNIPVKYNAWVHLAVIFDLEDNQLSLYIDGKEEKISVDFANKTTLTQVILGGTNSIYGHIDLLRAYSRLLTSYEIISNSQYTDLFLTYRESENGKEWRDWKYSLIPILSPELREKEIYIKTDNSVINDDTVLTFLSQSDKAEEVYISGSPIEAGVEDTNTTLLDKTNNTYTMENIKYLDLWFSPQQNENLCLLNISNSILETNTDGKILLKTPNKTLFSEDSYILGKQNHIAIKVENTRLIFFLNGNRTSIEIPNYQLPPEGSYSISQNCSSGLGEATVEKVRISSEENIDVYEVANIENRKYITTPTFKATLSNPLFAENKNMYLKEETNSSNYVQNLNAEDILVIEEGEYKLEGKVVQIDKATGLVEVEQWSGQFPSTGFTNQARIYKWQREYIPVKRYIDSDSSIFLNSRDNLVLKDIQLISFPKEDNSLLPMNNLETAYLQYKFVFFSKLLGLTPYLSSVNINYTNSRPAMEQIMRHGKWFSDKGEEPFWWAK